MPKIVGMRENLDWELFDTFLVDTRPSPSDLYTTAQLAGDTIRFFTSSCHDVRASNMLLGGQLPSDESFCIKRIRLQAAFSSPELAEEFFNTSVFWLTVGCKNVHELPTAAFAQRKDDAEDGPLVEAYPNGYLGTIELDTILAIPARQCFEATIKVSPAFARMLSAAKQYALVRVALGGRLTCDVF